MTGTTSHGQHNKGHKTGKHAPKGQRYKQKEAKGTDPPCFGSSASCPDRDLGIREASCVLRCHSTWRERAARPGVDDSANVFVLPCQATSFRSCIAGLNLRAVACSRPARRPANHIEGAAIVGAVSITVVCLDSASLFCPARCTSRCGAGVAAAAGSTPRLPRLYASSPLKQESCF